MELDDPRIGAELSLINAGAPGAMDLDEGALQQLMYEYRVRPREQAMRHLIRVMLERETD